MSRDLKDGKPTLDDLAPFSEMSQHGLFRLFLIRTLLHLSDI
jgi:hypothetical protein